MSLICTFILLPIISTVHYIHSITIAPKQKIIPYGTLNYVMGVSEIFQKNCRPGPLCFVNVTLHRPCSILHGYFLFLRPANKQKKQLALTVSKVIHFKVKSQYINHELQAG